MTFMLLILGLLVFGVLILGLGALLLFLVKNKLAGSIVIGVGFLMVVFSVLAFLSLVITTRTMG